MNSSLERYIHGGMLVLRDTTPASDASRAMLEKRVGSVVVCNAKGKIVALVTDRDLATQVLAFGFDASTPIGDFFEEELLKVSEDDTLEDAIQLMEANGVRRIPIIHETKSGLEKCVGIVTLDDLIVDQAVGPDVLRRIITRQVLRPRRPRLVRTRAREESDKDVAETKLEHSLNRFYSLASKHMQIARPVSDQIAYHLLGSIVRRLPVTGASQLISQLPRLLQEDLLELRAGPNRNITAESVLSEVESGFGMTRESARSALEKFWEALREFTGGSGEPEQALNQLPKSLQNLLKAA